MSISELQIQGGTALTRKDDEGIYIVSMSSDQKGSGFGTAVYRETMRSFFADKVVGKVTADASYRSHLFHLYMGMVPSKPWSYIRFEFVPRLLDILEKDPKEKYPNTYDLGTVRMVMSGEGMDRWRGDCNNPQKPFVPFRDLTPLRTYMNKEQLDRLDKIFSVWEASNPKRLKIDTSPE